MVILEHFPDQRSGWSVHPPNSYFNTITKTHLWTEQNRTAFSQFFPSFIANFSLNFYFLIISILLLLLHLINVLKLHPETSFRRCIFSIDASFFIAFIRTWTKWENYIGVRRWTENAAISFRFSLISIFFPYFLWFVSCFFPFMLLRNELISWNH